MKTIKVKQGTKDWITERSTRLTASVVAAVADRHDYYSRNKVTATIAAGIRGHFAEPNYQTKQMQYGSNQEEGVRKAFEMSIRKRGAVVQEYGFCVHDEFDWLGCSPDGIVVEKDGSRALLEIKCPSTKWEEIPQYVLDQCQLSMHIMDCEFTHLLILQDKSAMRHKLQRSADWWEVMFPLMEAVFEDAKAAAAIESDLPEELDAMAVEYFHLSNYKDEMDARVKDAKAAMNELEDKMLPFVQRDDRVLPVTFSGIKVSSVKGRASPQYAEALKEVQKHFVLDKKEFDKIVEKHKTVGDPGHSFKITGVK